MEQVSHVGRIHFLRKFYGFVGIDERLVSVSIIMRKHKLHAPGNTFYGNDDGNAKLGMLLLA